MHKVIKDGLFPDAQRIRVEAIAQAVSAESAREYGCRKSDGADSAPIH